VDSSIDHAGSAVHAAHTVVHHAVTIIAITIIAVTIIGSVY
jgi:hypothetical protein